jgi:protein-tyrosine phosphatase
VNVVPVHLLFTCTANQVRSPLAAAIARRRIDELALPVQVRSAGQLESGEPAVEKIVKVARRFDVDLSEHQSTRISPELLAWSDLIVTMTGRHVLDLIDLAPECRSRTITLKEWAHAAGDGRTVPGWTPEQVHDWASEVSQRPIAVLLSGSMDVADPVGRATRFYRRAAQEIDELLSICFRADHGPELEPTDTER